MSDTFLTAVYTRDTEHLPVLAAARDIVSTCTSSTHCTGTSIAVARFLTNTRRKSVCFVNPSGSALGELSRAAKRMSLTITSSEEQNVGSIVRLIKAIEPPLELPPPSPHVACGEAPPSPHGLCGEEQNVPRTPAPPARSVSFNTHEVVKAVRRVVSDSSERPSLTEDGTGGVYLIRESSDGVPLPPVAVFKPADEEAGSENNPRGLSEHVMREGFRPGGGAVRERVAYKLDRGFAGVPRTALERLLLRSKTGKHLTEQCGSIQEFVGDAVGDASEFRFDGSERGGGAGMSVTRPRRVHDVCP